MGLLDLLAVLTSGDVADVQLATNRAMFLVQALQKMLMGEGSEADISDIAQIAVLTVITNLVDTIQGMSGSHWGFMFDLAETIIDSTSWDDLIGISAVCAFLARVQACAESSKEFNGRVQASSQNLAEHLLVAVAGALPDLELDQQRAALEVVMPALYSIPSATAPNAAKAISLVSAAGSGDARYAAFCIAAKCITKSTGDLVLAVETRRESDDPEELAMALEPALLALLKAYSGVTCSEMPGQAHSELLLAWLLVFQHFGDTTPAIRAAYLEEIRRSDLVPQNFLPLIFHLLQVSDRSRGVDLMPWSVQTFVVEDLHEDDTSSKLHCFAANVYYKALQTIPSLIKAEWESYKNKQLSTAVSTFTARYFSPILIENELESVQKEMSAGLSNDENMVVKVLPSVSEVKATYLVDEHPMEISIRVPPEFPLAAVEVREGKKVGVPEATWRAWLLNIQLVISSHNGSIADAMLLFKANASRHFEGVEACAICYSVISVNDRSMPTKRCRTCKNLFHPSCLYKWFSTSHGSTCPLCRSLF